MIKKFLLFLFHNNNKKICYILTEAEYIRQKLMSINDFLKYDSVKIEPTKSILL